MIIAVEDKSYRCKNCDSFSQCEYYLRRRPDSHICKEFRNDWRQRDVLDKISAEIREDYDPTTEGRFADDTYDAFEQGKKYCLDIIEKYKGDKE